MSFITKQESYKIPQPVVIQPANNQVATTSPVATHGHVVGRQPNRPRLIHVSVMVVHGAVTHPGCSRAPSRPGTRRQRGWCRCPIRVACPPSTGLQMGGGKREGIQSINQSFSQLVRKAGRSADTYMQTHTPSLQA